MHFVFTAPRFHTNQRFAFKALLDAGHEVSALVLRRGTSEAYDVLEPRVLGCSGIFDALRRVAALLPAVSWSEVGGIPPVLRFWRELRRLNPDVVVVRSPSSAYGLLAVFAAKSIGARLVLYNQSPRFRKIGRVRRKIEVLFLALTGAGWYSPVLGDPNKYETSNSQPSYVPFVMVPQVPPVEKRWFYGGQVNLLHVGKFEPRKNHRMFLRAVARLLSRHMLRATIAGECSTQRHRRELEAVLGLRNRLGLEEVVKIRTNVPYFDMDGFYGEHDLFVLASRDEPAAVSHLEAMAYSMPVVCSDANGTSCYVKQGVNGYIFRSGDIDDLEACIERVIRDRERLLEMGCRSFELVSSEHDPRNYVDAVVAMAGIDR